MDPIEEKYKTILSGSYSFEKNLTVHYITLNIHTLLNVFTKNKQTKKILGVHMYFLNI